MKENIDYCDDCGNVVDINDQNTHQVTLRDEKHQPLTDELYLMCGECYERAQSDGYISSSVTFQNI